MVQGHFDGGMFQLTQRHQQRQKRRKTADLRAIVMQQRLPEPGALRAPSPIPDLCTSAQKVWLQDI